VLFRNQIILRPRLTVRSAILGTGEKRRPQKPESDGIHARED
jgi:hypothetical protein